MSAQHTPGPWTRGHMGDCENAWIGPDFDQPLVAKVDRNDRDEWEANARLIAAAPDLLRELRNAVVLLEELGVVNSKGGTLEAAHAAIAKATKP